MNDDEVSLTRADLYELVWTKPMARLAPEFGISDVALTKRCKRLGIPYPGLGYWARVAAGQKLKRPSLPPAPKHLRPYELSITFRKPNEGPPDEQVPERPPPDVPVADTLCSPHPVVKQLREELAKARPDHNDLLRVPQTRATDTALKIGRDSTSRALRILDGLFKVLDARGHTVELGAHGWKKKLQISAVVANERVEMSLEEVVGKRPHVPTDDEKRRQKTWGAQIPKNDGYPSGQLKLRIRWGRSWSDTTRDRLENLLGRAVLDAEQAARAILQSRLERERQEAARKAEEQKQIRRQRLDWYSQYLAHDLRGKTEDWIKGREIRAFLAAYEDQSAGQRDPVAELWLTAAKACADSADPLKNLGTVAMELEPSDEALAEVWEKHGPKDARQTLY